MQFVLALSGGCEPDVHQKWEGTKVVCRTVGALKSDLRRYMLSVRIQVKFLKVT